MSRSVSFDDLDELVPDEWQTVIEREERNDDRVVNGGED